MSIYCSFTYKFEYKLNSQNLCYLVNYLFDLQTIQSFKVDKGIEGITELKIVFMVVRARCSDPKRVSGRGSQGNVPETVYDPETVRIEVSQGPHRLLGPQQPKKIEIKQISFSMHFYLQKCSSCRHY